MGLFSVLQDESGAHVLERADDSRGWADLTDLLNDYAEIHEAGPFASLLFGNQQ